VDSRANTVHIVVNCWEASALAVPSNSAVNFKTRGGVVSNSY